MTRRHLTIAFLVLTLGWAPYAAADPFQVVSPSRLDWDSGDPLAFSFHGDFGTAAGVLFFDVFDDVTLGGRCTPCAPGTVLSADASFGPGLLGEGGFRPPGGDLVPVFWHGTLNFETGTSVVAARGWLSPQPRFTFTGELSGYANEAGTGAPLFEGAFFGSGYVDLLLGTYDRDPSLLVTEANGYWFDAAQDPVPEPATMLLAGAGLAYIGRRARARRRPI